MTMSMRDGFNIFIDSKNGQLFFHIMHDQLHFSVRCLRYSITYCTTAMWFNINMSLRMSWWEYMIIIILTMCHVYDDWM